MNSNPLSTAHSNTNSNAELELTSTRNPDNPANNRLNHLQLVQNTFSRLTDRSGTLEGLVTTSPPHDMNYLSQVKAAVIHSLQNPRTITTGYGIAAGAAVGTVIPSSLRGYINLINQSIEMLDPTHNNINPDGQYNIGAALVNRSSYFCSADYISDLTERTVCEQTAGLIKELVNNGWLDEVIDGSVNKILKEGYKEFIDSASDEFSSELESIKDGFETYSGTAGVGFFSGIAGYALGHALANIIFKDALVPLLVKAGDYFAGENEDRNLFLVELDACHRRLVSLTTLLSSVVGAGLIATACQTYINSLSEIGSTPSEASIEAWPYIVGGAALLLGNFLFGSFIGTGIHKITTDQMR